MYKVIPSLHVILLSLTIVSTLISFPHDCSFSRYFPTLQLLSPLQSLPRFYKGLPPLWMRQIPYTMMKFAAFERTIEFLYKYVVPKPRWVITCVSSLWLDGHVNRAHYCVTFILTFTCKTNITRSSVLCNTWYSKPRLFGNLANLVTSGTVEFDLFNEVSLFQWLNYKLDCMNAVSTACAKRLWCPHFSSARALALC